jgi:hypothetical protein
MCFLVHVGSTLRVLPYSRHCSSRGAQPPPTLFTRQQRQISLCSSSHPQFPLSVAFLSFKVGNHTTVIIIIITNDRFNLSAYYVTDTILNINCYSLLPSLLHHFL